MKKLKLLYFTNSFPLLGGQVVIFEQVYEDLSKMKDINIKKVNINLMKSWKILLFFFRIIYGLVSVPFYDVISFQASYNYIHFLGPIVFIWSKFWHKPVVLRTSAGNNIDLYYERNKFFQKILKRTILNADISFYETKYQVKYFSYLSENKVKYMPNNRRYIETNWKSKQTKAHKFLYLGWIDERKGVQMLIDTFSEIVEKYPVELDIFGTDYIGIKNKIKKKNIRIFDPFPPNKIYEVLEKYDALVLPSYREGIPGVIVEAFMLDKPVISTYLPSIMEIIDNRVTGLLVKVGDSEELKEAIVELHTNLDLYNTISKNVHNHKKKFDRAYWSKVYADEIRNLVSNKPVSV